MENFLKISEFSPTNIASILGGCGKNLGKSIDIFLKNGKKLDEFIQRTGFEASNVSSMLHGSRANIEITLADLFANEKKLHILTEKGRKPRAVSYKLSKSGNNLSQNIEKLIRAVY